MTTLPSVLFDCHEIAACMCVGCRRTWLTYVASDIVLWPSIGGFIRVASCTFDDCTTNRHFDMCSFIAKINCLRGIMASQNMGRLKCNLPVPVGLNN